MKLEQFIFDTFPWAQRPALLEVARSEQFAPVKNAPGSTTDSPDTARLAVLQLHTRCEPNHAKAAILARCKVSRSAILWPRSVLQ